MTTISYGIFLGAFSNALPTIIILVVCVGIVVFLVSKPGKWFKKNPFSTSKGLKTIDDIYNEERKELETTIDQILEKIHKKGLHSLSKREKEILTKHSQKK